MFWLTWKTFSGSYLALISLGRAVTHHTDDWGRFEQIGPLLRCGPAPAGGPPLMLPGVGEHTVEVLTGLGTPDAEIDALLAAEVANQLTRSGPAVRGRRR